MCGVDGTDEFKAGAIPATGHNDPAPRVLPLSQQELCQFAPDSELGADLLP